MTLTEFLLARISDDEAVGASLGSWGSLEGPFFHILDDDPESQADFDTKDHAKMLARLLARYGVPDRVLAECEAKRRIVELHAYDEDFAGCGHDQKDMWPCPTLRLLALPYADHPDYRREWKS